MADGFSFLPSVPHLHHNSYVQVGKYGRKRLGAAHGPSAADQLERPTEVAQSRRKRMITDYLVPVFIGFFLRQFFFLPRGDGKLVG